MIQLSNYPLTLSGSCEGVGVDETVDDRVIITTIPFLAYISTYNAILECCLTLQQSVPIAQT